MMPHHVLTIFFLCLYFLLTLHDHLSLHPFAHNFYKPTIKFHILRDDIWHS